MYIEIEPDTLDTSSTIVINCYSSSSKSQKLSCSYTWSLQKNKITTPINNKTNNIYHCSPYDLGAKILVDIRSPTQSKSILVGVVRMDSLLKKDVLNIIQQQSANFIVKIQEKEYVITINQQKLQITEINTQRSAQYLYNNQRFLIGNKQGLIVPQEWKLFLEGSLNKSPNTQSQSQIKFLNRTIRDLFIFSYRGLSIKAKLGSSHIVHILNNLQLEKSSNFNYLMEIEELSADLQKFRKINKRFQKQKQQLHKQNKYLKEKVSLLQVQNNALKHSQDQVALLKQKPSHNGGFHDKTLAGLMQNLSQSMARIPQLDRVNQQINQLTDENSSLKNQVYKYKRRQKQMQNVIQYLQQYRDKVKIQTGNKEGNFQQQLLKCKTRLDELIIQNQFIFKQKQGLAKQAQMHINNTSILDLKYKRTLQIIDECYQKLQEFDLMVERYKKQIHHLSQSNKSLIKNQNMVVKLTSSNEQDCGNYKRKYQTLLEQYTMFKRSHDALNRSRDLSLTANLMNSSYYDYHDKEYKPYEYK